MTVPELAARAAWYASQGVPVFPLRPGHKKPLPGSHGVDDATTDAATVAAWWAQHPDANIGAACGVLFDVVDVDGPGGAASLDALYPGGWPATVARVRTPRPGGLHCYVPTMGAPVKVGGRGGLPKGVDTRGAGGYVVLPPSTLVELRDAAGGIDQHAGVYAWEGDTPTFGPPDVSTVRACKPWRRVWDTPVPVVAPAGPRATLTPSQGTSRYGARVLDDEAATVAAAAPGGRNDALNRAAFKVGQLVPHEIPEADALAALADAARACGLPDAEAAATIRSGLTNGMKSPREPRERPADDPLAGLLDRTPAPRIDPATGEVLDDAAPVDDAQVQDAPRTRYRFTPGGSFILDAADRHASWWGGGDAILGAEGEALLIAGPQGTGKSTLGQQLSLGASGFPEYSELLGLPITATRGRVLYLAMDRPRQIARSLRRMVGAAWRDELDARVSVWTGPPPFDLAKHPSVLRQMCEDAGASFVVVDSLKDAFLGLTDDEAAAAWNRARQTALAAGIDVCELHHTRKAGQGKGATDSPGVDSIYGSTWITSGCGSVVLLTGAPGDPIVGFHHVKQPMSPVGPFKLLHDQDEGRTSVWHAADLVGMARARGHLSALDAAGALFETDKPTPANKESARRRLEALTRAGLLVVLDEGDKGLKRPRLWGPM